MKRARNIHRFGVLILIAGWLLLVSPALAFAQEEADVESEEVSEVAADEAAEAGEAASTEGSEAEEADAEETDPNMITLNLNNVNVDQVIKFLSEITDKFVVKHKDVKAQITVFSPKKVSKEKAFAVICEALLLQKVAVVRTDDTIKLIPIELLSETVVELLPPGVDQVPAGMVRKPIPIRFTDVAEMENLIKPLLSKNGSLLAHPSSKQIIVMDNASRVANIEAVVAQLDVLKIDQRQVQIFALRHADAEEIAPILRSVLGALAQKAGGAAPGRPPDGGPPDGRPQPGRPPGGASGGGVEVVPYKATNWLVVVVPKELTDKTKSLVDELDRARPQELQMRSLILRYADANDLARQLTSLFRRRPEKRVRDMVEITSDDRSGSLLVLSSEENFALIKNVVEELDTEDSVQTMTKTYPLEYADAEDIAEQMNSLYSGMQQDYYDPFYYYYSYSRRGQQARTRFVPERRTNSVIAIAKPSEFEKISKLIEKLDQPIDAEQVAPRIFRIRYVDATELTEVLNKIFGVEDSTGTSGYYDYLSLRYSGGKEEVGRLYGKVRFVPETTTNSIIVTTNNKENFKIIGNFIKDLDKFSPEAANTMVVTLKNAKATNVADQVNSLFAREGARMPERRQTEEEEAQSAQFAWLYGSPQKKEVRAISNLIGQVRVVPDNRTNSLLVTTAVQNFELLRELIASLDVESPKVQVRVRLVEITTTKESRIGTRFSSDPSTFSPDDFDNGLMSTFGMTWEEIHGNATLSGDVNVSMLVQFLQRESDSRVLAEPLLVMNNNQESSIFAGEEFLYPTASQVTPQGGVTRSFAPREAGIRLKITPNINDINKVVMKVELEASQTRAGEESGGAPIIDKRMFNTELAVATGDTMVVGGIVRDIDSEQIRRIPILGHIPGLGALFRKRDTKRETIELVAFITPTVLRTSEDDMAATAEAAARITTKDDWNPLRDLVDGPGTGENATPEKES